MGWASAGDIFDPVAQALIDCGATDVVKREVLGRLIQQLRSEDWDTCDESLEQFRDDPVIVELFHRDGWGNTADGAETEGVLDWEPGSESWVLRCTGCGRLEVSDGTAEEHDRLVRLWAQHDQDRHNGDGIVPAWMFIHREVDA